MSILAIVLIILLFGGIGLGYPYGGRPGYWGYGWGGGGVIGLILIVVLILALVGRI
jgi:hypothetical protein